MAASHTIYFRTMENCVTYEFHVSRQARDRYKFNDVLFSLTGNVVFANVKAAREFAERINRVRGAEHDPEKAARASDLNAMGLIDEALHALMAIYRQRRDPKVIIDALGWFGSRLGSEKLEQTLMTFAEQFPVVAVYRGKLSAEEWLRGETGGVPHRAVAMEEMMMLWLANANPAYRPYGELFDEMLLKETAYRGVTGALREYFETRPKFGRREQNLFDVLRAPAMAAPESLSGQLAYLRDEWGEELGDILRQILVALDVLKEEELATWLRFHPPGPHADHFGKNLGWLTGGDSSAAAIPHFGKELEYERFSPDVHWMPSTVLLAKTVYVWLDQLSKRYHRDIYRLDQIPDEELDVIARRGFNSLWLIGIWERSKASRRIKQLTGNPEAVASAYSLADYRIADDLGGEAAFESLRDRARHRGIRLASDMVPNHMGIDSRWVIEHPDWFISLPYSPFPVYSFNGPDLSEDGRVEIKVEDHYYNRTDAAVVFRRTDRWTGDTRYIYHGNDGTSFPWNDTAQLDYLNPEVREAVIQTILHVARRFPIIRFDAAMTLTKQHYQRLWFPQPGTGGAIPSRAEHGLTKAEFDRAMPNEFWRELVDRVAVECPDTLLLAEAFWLLEGYFVRTLGMHRVYNSAFMNMLRDEENANYRSVLKNTLEFDPEVLKRYVNFMNNPDERTAVDQFGKGDKYFGTCTLLATLPGLPMFGHGQIEGYAERYGMEYRKAYHDEHPDEWLVGRHEREISPLLHRRPLFAEVENFLLYDFFADSGHVNEDVFAYSNRLGDQRGLILYHNRWGHTSGWIRVSVGYAEKAGDGSKRVVQKTLADSFGLRGDGDQFVAYRDAYSGQEFLHASCDVSEKGLRFDLGAYQYRVLLDWRDLRDDATHPWGELCRDLGGRGVPSLDEALRALKLKPLHEALRRVLAPKPEDDVLSEEEDYATEGVATGSLSAAEEAMNEIEAKAGRAEETLEGEEVLADPIANGPVKPRKFDWTGLNDEPERLSKLAEEFFTRAQQFVTSEVEHDPASKLKPETEIVISKVVGDFRNTLKSALRVPDLEDDFSSDWPVEARTVLPSEYSVAPRAVWGTVVAWALLQSFAKAVRPSDADRYAFSMFEDARFRQVIADACGKLGLEGEDRWRAAARVRFAFAHASSSHNVRKPALTASAPAPYSWLHDPDVRWLIGVHEYKGVRYFNKESFEQLLWWTALRPLVEIASEDGSREARVFVTGAKEQVRARVREVERDLNERFRAAAEAGYRVEALIEQVNVL